MEKNDVRYQAYLRILKEELIPAMGCTEPIAVAYAASLARDVLGRRPERLEVNVSGNILKNVKSVVVPNTGHLRGTAAAPDDDAFERLVAEYSERYRAHQADAWREHVRVFAGVPEMLAALERGGCELAVVTSRTAPTCFAYLRHFDLAKHFPVVCTPDNTDKHKPDPEPAVFALNALLDGEARTGGGAPRSLGHVARSCRRDAIPRDVLDHAWFVGDALTDVQCGNACGAKSILARWGPETSKEGTAAAEQAATHVARAPEDVLRLVLRDGCE